MREEGIILTKESMKFRKAVDKDVNNIMGIIKQAQEYLRKHGVDQWQDGYPNIETIKKDIVAKYGYILEKDNEVIGTAAISFEGEKTYNVIHEGQWLTREDYAVVHRVAIRDDYKGLGVSTEIIKNVELICLNEGVKSIKIDTHEDNKAMQKLLGKNNFKYCGVIYLEDGNKRLGFEKVL